MLEGRIFVRTFKNRICKSENIFKKSKIRISIVYTIIQKFFFYFVIKNNSWVKVTHSWFRHDYIKKWQQWITSSGEKFVWRKVWVPNTVTVDVNHRCYLYKNISMLLLHSSEKRGSRSTFLSGKMLQNLPYL